jgi:hypothetical protein
VISSMMMVNPAHATGNVPVSISCSSYTLVNSQSPGEVAFEVPGFPTAAAACAYENFGLGSSFPNGSYSCASPYTFWWAVCAAVNSCPANSMPTGSTCTCNTGYQPDPTGTSCVLPACPDHASRTTPGAACTCDANYQFDATGTSCIQEQYTIALSGLGGEVMPTKTRAAYAEVTSSGSPKSGAQVTLILTVVPENGDPILASNVGSVSPNGGSTGADGRLPFVFTAPVAGGTHTITATCTGCTNEATGTIRVPGCSVPPLTSPPFTDPVAEGFENGNRWRQDLLTADYQNKLACVQNAITAAGGTFTPTSAYRPTQYQQHLFEIIDRDSRLDPDTMNTHPECQALRNKVTQEMGGHGLRHNQLVAEPDTSRHESGTAFDLTPNGLTDAQLAPVYTGCGVSHTAVTGEPWHVQ